MRAAVRKLGNSSGVIIPKSLLTEIGVAIGEIDRDGRGYVMGKTAIDAPGEIGIGMVGAKGHAGIRQPGF